MRKFIKIVGVNLGLIVLLVVIAELIFGGWIGTNYGIMLIPKDFYRKFDVSHLYKNDSGFSYYKRDKYGLRGSYDDLSKIDIITIGGSTTDEIFVDEGKTWSDTIARLFALDNKKITVVNAGIAGHTTVGHIRNFELWFPKIPNLKARYIIAYIGINDSVLFRYYMNGKHGIQSTRNLDKIYEQKWKIKQYLINNSALYTLFRNIRGMVRARAANLVHIQKNWDGRQWTEPQKSPDVDAFAKKYAMALADYAWRIKQLAQAIRSFGAKPIFVTQHRGSYRIRNNKVFFAPGKDGTLDDGDYIKLAALARVTMQTCHKVKAICIDLANELYFTDGDHYDGVHTTPQGSEKIGRHIYGKLKNIIMETSR